MASHKKSYDDYLALIETLQPFYVFGFGSLMWSPEFPYEKKIMARLDGHHRRFGMWSVHYRGTAEKPGLVLGLDDGGYTVGICFQVAEKDRLEVAKNLWDREMVSYAYEPLALDVVAMEDMAMASGEMAKPPMKALAFALDPDHEQYADPALSLVEQAQVIATSVGTGGPNRDYFLNMVESLKKLNIEDDYIAALYQEFEKIQ